MSDPSAVPAPVAPSGVLSVVVVDDSAAQRRFVRGVLESDPELTVVGEAANGRDAVALVDRLRPGAVLMDLELPILSGIEAIERIMAMRPTPILVYSSAVGDGDNERARDAIAAGAVDVMCKPGTGDDLGLDEYARLLRRRLRVIGRVKVITHPRARLRARAMPLPFVAPGRYGADLSALPPPAFEPLPTEVKLVAIGASTGGPHALATLLAGLPGDLDAAVVVVQHMAEGFIEGLAEWLDGLCHLPVVVGRDERRLVPGTVTVAPSGRNLVVHEGLRVTTEAARPAQYHVPSVDETFCSVATAAGSAAIGVLLTGMGRDGAAGLKAMRDSGACTIAQDESTSAVYGMPQAAQAIGAVDHQLALPEIAPALLALIGHPCARPEGAA